MKSCKLSYSSMSTVLKCQQKYWHYKVNSTPKDEDYEESDALGLGKAFHQVLEKTLHQDYNQSLIMQAMADHEVSEDEEMLLEVMLKKYVEYHKRSGLRVVKCELMLETPIFQGFIDFIATDDRGWWIGDLKTASRFDEGLLPRLPMDMQLNLYSHFADEIANALELKGKFLGCRYRQITKSKAGTMSGLEKGVIVRDIEVPVETMNPQFAWNQFLESHQTALELHNGVAPKRNYSACMDFFKPCEYFSKCHGDMFSQSGNKVKVHTIESINGADLL